MSNVDKIKAEIERLKKILEESTYYLDNSQQALGYSFALDDFKEFIDSLPEEKQSEDLEEAAIDFADNARKQLYSKDYAISSIADYDHGCIDGFIAGAEWQKEHLTVEDIKTILDISFWNDDPEYILEEYNRIK